MVLRVVLLDTSVLCCLLAVPGKETAGSDDDRWDENRIRELIAYEAANGSTLVLPLASLIETGNHVAQAPGNRHAIASALCNIIALAANASSPWAAFTDQAILWGPEKLIQLTEEWPALAAGKLSIGDATIKNVAEYYSAANFDVEIVTADKGLRAYQPAAPQIVPRRRQRANR